MRATLNGRLIRPISTHRLGVRVGVRCGRMGVAKGDAGAQVDELRAEVAEQTKQLAVVGRVVEAAQRLGGSRDHGNRRARFRFRLASSFAWVSCLLAGSGLRFFNVNARAVAIKSARVDGRKQLGRANERR